MSCWSEQAQNEQQFPLKKKKKKRWGRGFPGDSVVKNLPANAGDMSSIPDLGRSHRLRSNKACALYLLSLWSRAQEPQLRKPRHPRAHAPQEKPAQWEACTLQLERSPCLLQLEKAHVTKKTRHRPKKSNSNKEEEKTLYICYQIDLIDINLLQGEAL